MQRGELMFKVNRGPMKITPCLRCLIYLIFNASINVPYRPLVAESCLCRLAGDRHGIFEFTQHVREPEGSSYVDFFMPHSLTS